MSNQEGAHDADSAATMPTIKNLIELYDRIGRSRSNDPVFASKVLNNAFDCNFGPTTTFHTLEATLALLKKHPTNGYLERLPFAVERVYALTPARTKKERIDFLAEVKEHSHLDMSEIERKARTFYRPSPGEFQTYVADLSRVEQAIIYQSGVISWDQLRETEPFSSHKKEIAHFERVEKQFGVTLRDFLPQPSSR